MLKTMRKGFTLVELLVYIAFISIIAAVFVNFAIDIIGSSQKARVRQEVQQNARFALERILQEIRAAEGINTGASTFGSHPGVLSLDSAVPAQDPTVFDISGGQLRVTYGASSPETLTSPQYQVSNLVFENFSVANRTQHVRVSLTLAHANPEGIEEFNASITVRGSAVIRELVD